MMFQQRPDDETARTLITLLQNALNQPLPSGKANQNLMYAKVAILSEAVRLAQFMESKALLSIALSKVWPHAVPICP